MPPNPYRYIVFSSPTRPPALVIEVRKRRKTGGREDGEGEDGPAEERERSRRLLIEGCATFLTILGAMVTGMMKKRRRKRRKSSTALVAIPRLKVPCSS